MGLLDKIESDLHSAIREKNENCVRTLRMIKSDIMYEKAKGTEDLPDEKVLEIVKRAQKKRKEAIAEFEKAGRKELADREREEIDIIDSYLPKQLDEQAVTDVIDRIVAESGAVTQKDFGRVMGKLMKELKGQVDGALVKELLTKKLESL